jgi:hypothetical protein
LIGNENVNLCILPVADVIDETDLGSHEIEIAEVAVEKDAEADWRRRGIGWSRLLGICRGKSKCEENDSEKKIKAGRAH